MTRKLGNRATSRDNIYTNLATEMEMGAILHNHLEIAVR